MKHLFLAMAVMVTSMLGVAAVHAEGDAPKEVAGATTVDTDKVLEMIEGTEGLVIIDSRKDADYQSGWIEGAVHLVNTDTNTETLAKVIATKETPAMFYCNGAKCLRSSDAVKKAAEAGYTNLFYYYGGMADWKEAGMPVVTK